MKARPAAVFANNVPPSHTRIRQMLHKRFLSRGMRDFEAAVRRMVEQELTNPRNISFREPRQLHVVWNECA